MTQDRDRSETDPILSTGQVLGSIQIRLDELEPSRCATICSVDATDASASQLMAMGVCVGRQIEVVKQGDPLILRVFGSRIGVSARLAGRVKVELCAGSQCQTPSC